MKHKLIIILVLFGCSTLSFSQKEVRNKLRTGNKEYHQKKYTESEITYRKALEANAKSPDVAYNLGNSLFMQKKYPEAVEQYQAAISNDTVKLKKAWSWHNTGNVFLEQATANKEDQAYNENLKKSIEAYKSALRNNPKDDETRYNLALAQKLLKDNEQDGGGDKNDQQQDKKEDQEKKQDQQEQKQDQQQQKQDQQQQQQQPQMSKENAQQILDAMMQDEKNTQDKVKEQKAKAQQRKRTDKEW